MSLLTFEVSLNSKEDVVGALRNIVQDAIAASLRGQILEKDQRGQIQPSDCQQLLIDSTQVCDILKLSRKTIFNLHTTGRMPKPIKVGSAVRWNFEELRQWVNAGCPKRI